MGHENIGTDLRDRIAEIFSDYRRPSQATSNLNETHYAYADEVIAMVATALSPPPEAEIAALREFASAVLAHEALDEPTMDEHNASVLRVRAGFEGLRRVGFVPTDRAPIEEGRTA